MSQRPATAFHRWASPLLQLFTLLGGLGTAIVPAAASAQAPLPAGVKAVASVEGIQAYEWPNGLQVLLIPDDSKPTTTVNMTYRVGSRHENYGETGMAHLLEHLLFKGSKRFPTAWAEFSQRGLRANGSTWLDRTNYFASFTANPDNLRWYLSWQADAMVNAHVAKKDLDTEMTVVRNEMERGENDPGSILFERTLATMYQWHNYGKSTIGARSDVEGVDIERLRAFYKTHYQPDNATLIVAGQFKPEQVIAWVHREFGPLPRSKRPRPTLYTIDPVQDGERELVLRRSGGTPMVYAGYHVPAGAHPDTAAVELINLMLTDAPGGRLHQQLVASQKAAAVFGFNAVLHDPGFVMFGAQLTPTQDPAALKPAMTQVLESLAQQPFTEAELVRARSRWLRDWEQRFTDPEQVGVALSEFVALGDWRLYFLLRDRVKAVALADVQRVAQAYLVRDNRTWAEYRPTDKPVRAPAPALVSAATELRSFTPNTQWARVEAFDASPLVIQAKLRQLSLEPGLKLSLLPKPTRGAAVSLSWSLRVGQLASWQGQKSAAQLWVSLLDKGSKGWSRQAVQDRLAELKSDLSIGLDGERVVVQLKSTREHLPQVLPMVIDGLRQPLLEASTLEEMRQQALAGLQASRDEPGTVLSVALDRWGNPYAESDPRGARSLEHIERDLKAVTVADVQRLQAQWMGVSMSSLAIVGDFDAPAVTEVLRQGLQGWASPQAPQRIERPLVALNPTRLQLSTPDKQNAVLSMRWPLALKDGDPDHAPLLVANFLMGGSGHSRLWTRIREKEGLSYDVRTQLAFNPHEAASVWTGGAIFAPQNLDRVERAFLEELDRAHRQAFSADEVQQAKQGLLNFRRLARAQDATLAAQLMAQSDTGRRMQDAQALDDAIAAVTPEAAWAAWKRHVPANAPVRGAAGDFKPRP